MIRSRASIASLLVVVGLLAVGFGALRVSSRLWANTSFSIALMMLVAAIAAMIYRRGRQRAFWAGIVLFGWTYWMVAFGPAPLNAWREWLVTTPILAMLEERLLIEADPKLQSKVRLMPSPRASTATYTELSPWTYWTSPDRSNPFSSDSFNRIGHSFFCLAVSLAGGLFCRLLHDTRDEPSPSP